MSGMPGRHPVASAAAALALCAALAPASPGATPDDPFSLLREAQRVTGATKRPQPLSETPSSVTIITAAEIRANGYHSVGEALRWVRGLFLTYDRNYAYLGVRGVQRPGDYNTKVLLALDGHTLNGNVFGEAYFGADLGIDMERIERIEVVRGPGSSLYGGDAVLAVVNLVTRRPRSEPGVTVSTRAGGPGEQRAFVAVASAGPGRPEWSLSGSILSARGEDLYFSEYDDPLSHFGRAVNGDREGAGALFANAAWGSWQLTAKYSDRYKRVPTGAYGTTFGDTRNRTYDGHDFVELSGTRALAPAVELQGRAYWDGARYHGYYVYGPDSATTVNVDHGDGDLVGGELRAHWSIDARNLLTLGAEGQYHHHVHLLNYDQSPYQLYLDRTVHRGVGAFYAQDELRFSRTAHLTAGARADGYSRHLPLVVSPRLDLVWNQGALTTWKLLTGTAFRLPTPYEDGYWTGYNGLPQPTLDPERVATVEAELEHHAGPLTLTLSAYASRIRDLIDLVAVDSVGNLQFANRQTALARGIEGEVVAVGAAGTRARLAVALQRSEDQGTHAVLTNSPTWNAHLVVTHAPAERRVSVGFGVRVLSPRLTLAGNHTRAAVVADARVGADLGHDLRLGLEAKNLADALYGDPASREHLQDQILQERRQLYLTLSYHRGQAP